MNPKTPDLGNAARIAGRELRSGLRARLRGFWVFLICLALGVAAIAAVGSVRDSIQGGLAREGAAILGGDAEVRLTYRRTTPEERAWLNGLADQVSEVIDFRSLTRVTAPEPDQALTQVLAVDGAYPLTGALILDPPIAMGEVLGTASGPGTAPGGLMERVLAERLRIVPGDTFQLGTQTFTLTAVIDFQPDSAGAGFNLGARTIVRTEALESSGLIAQGTLFESRYRLLLPPGTSLAEAEAAARAEFDGKGIRWRDSRNAAPGLSRFVDRLSAFLVLVGLAGLAIGGVGVSAAVRAYLETRTATIATLKTLGASGATILTTYLIEIGTLAVIGIGAGLTLGGVLPLLAAPLIEARLPLPAEIALRPGPLAEAALFGALSALLFTLWPLAQAQRIRPAALYRRQGAAGGQPGWGWWLVTLLILGALVGSAALLSGLVTLTLWTAAGLAGAFALLLVIAFLAQRGARRLAQASRLRHWVGLRHALGAVGGPGGQATPVVLSLGLGLSVLAAIGQIDTNLRGAIAQDLPDVAPAYFVIDIQPDQLAPLTTALNADMGVTRIDTAPMLRGVITRINDRPAAEVAGDHWVLNGDRGVTYSTTPPEGTVLIEGAWWPKDYTGEPLVSFAAEEAAEMGIGIGDTLTVNILGRDITVRIANLREVDFSSAGIGFIMSMSPNALAGAPHSVIATVYAPPESEVPILRLVSDGYPNVTAIRVRDAIDRVTGILGGIASAITYGALATLVTGVVVLIGAAAAGEPARTYEAAVLKTLGARRGWILANFALRSALLGLVAGAVAVLAGGLSGWAISRFVMETSFRFDAPSALSIVAGGVLVTTLAGLAFAWRPLASRPARILRAQE